MSRWTKDDREQAYKILKAIKGRSKKPLKVYAIVNSVSRSGMSRRIEFYTVINGNISRIGYRIAAVLDYGYDVDKGGLNVSGCGMDMIFSVLSNLNYKMAKLDYPGKSYEEIMDIIRTKYKQAGDRPDLYYSWYFCDADNYGRL